jgi:hypothetical protein
MPSKLFTDCCDINNYISTCPILVIPEDELLGLAKLKTLCNLQENLFYYSHLGVFFTLKIQIGTVVFKKLLYRICSV